MNYTNDNIVYVNPYDDDLFINIINQNENSISNKSNVIKCWFDAHNGTLGNYETLFNVWLIMHIINIIVSFMFPNVLHSAHIRHDKWQKYINVYDFYIILNSFILIIPYYFNSSVITNIYLIMTNGCYWYLYIKLLNRIQNDMYITMLLNHFYLGFITIFYLMLEY
jgi:hypothetical protein